MDEPPKQLAIVNPPIWEVGHVGWFHEKWILRGLAARKPLRENADALYDSSAVAHETRFSVDPYADYPRPWFGDHTVLRGGSMATRTRMMRNTPRSWTMPHRSDLFTGSWTCEGRG